MGAASITTTIPVDSPQTRRYNRIRRWLGIADFILGAVVLVVLLATGWSGTLRDIALGDAAQNYVLAVFLYVLMLMTITKLLGLGLDYYGFRLEHRFQLSNQRLRAWLWDEAKGFLVGLVLAAIVAELLYFIMRQAPQHWWLIAWVVFLGLFVLMAQLAPLVLFPIFYKFEPLQNEELKARLSAEGLFDAARKRALPPRPTVVAVVSSPSGAVWHDVTNVLRRRWPLVRVVLVGRPLIERVVARTRTTLPVRRGQRLGEVRVYDGGRLLGTRPLVAARSVARPGLGGRVSWYARRTVHELWSWVS